MEASESQQMPTQADMAAGAEVVEAGAQAAAAETDPTKRKAAAGRAIKREAKTKGWELSTEQAEMLAGMVASQIAEHLEQLPDRTADKIGERGGFDHLPEPLAIPPATGAGEAPAAPPVQEPGRQADEAPGAGGARGASAFAKWFRSQ